ncbi:MAG: hypothetical protein WCL60_17380, partial [Methylococcales bacterium]
MAEKTLAKGNLKNSEVEHIDGNVISSPTSNEPTGYIDFKNAKPMPLPTIEAPKIVHKPSKEGEKYKGAVKNGVVGTGEHNPIKVIDSIKDTK